MQLRAYLLLLALLAWSGGAQAVPQVGVSSFSIERNGGWSDAALGTSPTPGVLSAAELQAVLEVPGDAAARAQDPNMAAQGRGGLSGRLGDLLLLSPNQALDRWSATCTPDPVTVCKEAHTANQGTIGAMETAASSAAGAADGALAGSGNRLVLFAIIAVLTAVALVVTVMVGRGIASRRRLAAGWQAPVPS